ncbi:MAG: D-alanyl-D-alanine carboxypeptidase [Clostridiales bacterium]|nr:D-alanyl-D-alanine carboxypeptidase [Clostridiales bacterium]
MRGIYRRHSPYISRICFLIAVWAVLVCLCAQAAVAAAPGAGPYGVFDTPGLPDFDAEAYILVNRKTGQTICSKNPEKRMYPASTTKIMTGILALELGDLGMEMTASSKAIRDIGEDGSNIGIIAGEVMRLDNLMDALIVKSANEAANIIAENISGTQEGFIALMNQKAAQLGALNTNFVNTHGNHDESHYTTAYDLALISSYAMDNSQFREFAAKRSIILSPTNKHSSWEQLRTTNTLLLDESEKDYAVTGIKTGYTSKAGYCLVATGVDAGGTELLCVVLGVWGESASARRFSIASSLLEYGFENFGTSAFVSENELIETISVLGADSTDSVEALADGTVSLFLPADREKWNVSRIEYVKPEIAAPVAKGEILGYVEIRNNGVFAGRVNVVASKDVAGAKGGARQTSKRNDTGSARDGMAPEDGAVYLSSASAGVGAGLDGARGSGEAGGIGLGAGYAESGGYAAPGAALPAGGGGYGSNGDGGNGDGGNGGNAAVSAGAGGGMAGGNAAGGDAAGESGTGGADSGGGDSRADGAVGADADGEPLAPKILMAAFLVIMSLAVLLSVIRTVNKIRAGRRAQLSGRSMGRRQMPVRSYGEQFGARQGGTGGRTGRGQPSGGRPRAGRIGRPFGDDYGMRDGYRR